MLDDIALLESHTVIDGIELVLNLVELVHEHVGFPLLVFLLLLLGAHPVFKPLHLLLVILDLDLLLEEENLLLLPQTLNYHAAFSLCSALI